MEYVLYIIDTFSNFSNSNKNKYIDFIYQFIIKILKDLKLNNNKFNIYLGSLQLSNRLINVNVYKNIISGVFNNKIVNAIISFYYYYLSKKVKININFAQSNIFRNCLYNLIKIYKVERNDIVDKLKKI